MALEARGIVAVRCTLRDRPEALGWMRGRGPGLFASEWAREERAWAREAAERVVDLLDAQRRAETRAVQRWHDQVRQRRERDLVEVPGLSAAALDALRALRRAGADRSPEELARLVQRPGSPHTAEVRTAAVAVVWARVRDDARVAAEMDGFADAARRRLGGAAQQEL